MTYCDSCGHPSGYSSTIVDVNNKQTTLYFCDKPECQRLDAEALSNLALKHQERQRYAQPRKLVKWGSPKLKVLKMLAHVIVKHERAGKDRLWERSKAVYPLVMASVLPDDDASFDALCQVVLAKFGVPLTPEKLLQRADKTSRNHEFNEYLAAVEEAYLKIKTKAA